jgi:hypothetical protein
MSSRIVTGFLLGAGLAVSTVGSMVDAVRSAELIQKNAPAPTGLLLEVSLPPLAMTFEKTNVPPLDLKGGIGKTYADKADPDSRYCQAIHGARVLLWASAQVAPPKPLAADVIKLRKELKLQPALLRTRFDIPKTPANERQLKAQSLAANQAVARIMARMEDSLEELNKVAQDEKEGPARWRANHALIQASLLLRMSVLDEYSLALGNLRKELPTHGEDDRAWKLKATEDIHDLAARKRVKEARRLLEKLRKDHPDTVWDQQAGRLGRTVLGAAWEAVK